MPLTVLEGAVLGAGMIFASGATVAYRCGVAEGGVGSRRVAVSPAVSVAVL